MENKIKIKLLDIDEEIIKNCFKQKGSNKFYIYIHRRIKDNKPFYVGKGCNYRCTEVSSRTEYWKRIASKYGVYVHLYKYNLSEEKAYKLEKEIINKLKIKNLVNFKEGGIGGNSGKLNYFFGKKLYKEKNGNYMNRGIKNPLSQKVLKLDLNGNLIKKYNSISETELDGFCASTVSAVCNKRRRHHKNFIFVKESDYNSGINYELKKSVTDKKKINSYDLNMNFIKSYNSMSETKKDGFDPKKVSLVCLGKRKKHRETIFKLSV